MSDKSNDIKYINECENTIAATIIQWLGAPVGQGFLIKVNEQIEELS